MKKQNSNPANNSRPVQNQPRPVQDPKPTQDSSPVQNPKPVQKSKTVQKSKPMQNPKPVQNPNAARSSSASSADFDQDFITRNPRKAVNKKLWNSISTVFLVLLIVCEGWAFYRIWHLAVLPMKFFAPLAAVAAVITLLLGIMMFPKIGRHQKSKGIVRRIIAYILSSLIAVAAVFGGGALGKLDKTFNTITQTPTAISAYVDIFVKADDPIADIKDASQYTFAITDFNDTESTQNAIDALKEMWGTPVLTRTYPTIFAMVDGLYNGEVQGIIINEAFLAMLHEVEGYEDFETQTKLLHRHSVLTVQEPSTAPEQTDPSEATTVMDEGVYTPFLVYLSGSDTRSDQLAGYRSRSDVNILAAVNPGTKQVLLLNTPRDYFIPNPAYGNKNDKLTHCGLNGTENSAKALGQLYDQKISYTAQINFTGFQTLIDSIGGINIRSEIADGVFLNAGDNYMDGATALDFARDRYDYAAGDNARGQHQMQVITAVIEKMASGSIITNYSDILDSLQGMFVTTMPSEKISQLIKMQLDDMAKWNVRSFAVTGTGGNDIPAAMGVSAYVMYPNKADVQRAAGLIDKVMNDEILTEQDVMPKQ